MEMELIFAGQVVEMVDIAPTYFSEDQKQATEIITIRSKGKNPWMATVLAQDLTWRQKGKPWTRQERNQVAEKTHEAATRRYFNQHYMGSKWNGYLQSNGCPIVLAYTREEACKWFDVSFDRISHVSELSPKDRHPELIKAVNDGFVWQVN